MENAQLINLSRQAALRNQLNVVANNMANLTTTGYKTKRTLFEEFVMPVAEATEFLAGDENLSYVHDYGTAFHFSQGSVRETGNPLDIAIDGKGWFAIQMADGTEAYTRNGSFHLTDTGMLVEANGRPVLTEAGPIVFTREDGLIDITRDGTIVSALGVRGQVRLVEFETPQEMQNIGENLFTHPDPLPVTETRVFQGSLEQSNVVGVVEVTHMIEITRAYETVTKLMKDTDDLRQKAIQTLGRVEA
ncbi:MAG: flagellar basal-body rod protein FlgF [Rhodobacteraceae bacterium]|nr:flagellar basal-body rod protein FlgF [Paracoccaceae bacterium]